MNDLPELLDHYFSLGVAEGKEGRDHDTPDGEAQATRDLIDQKIQEKAAEARRQAFIEAAEIARAYPDREPFVGKAHKGIMISTGQELAGEEISSALRAKAEEV